MEPRLRIKSRRLWLKAADSGLEPRLRSPKRGYGLEPRFRRETLLQSWSNGISVLEPQLRLGATAPALRADAPLHGAAVPCSEPWLRLGAAAPAPRLRLKAADSGSEPPMRLRNAAPALEPRRRRSRGSGLVPHHRLRDTAGDRRRGSASEPRLRFSRGYGSEPRLPAPWLRLGATTPAWEPRLQPQSRGSGAAALAREPRLPARSRGSGFGNESRLRRNRGSALVAAAPAWSRGLRLVAAAPPQSRGSGLEPRLRLGAATPLSDTAPTSCLEPRLRHSAAGLQAGAAAPRGAAAPALSRGSGGAAAPVWNRGSRLQFVAAAPVWSGGFAWSRDYCAAAPSMSNGSGLEPRLEFGAAAPAWSRGSGAAAPVWIHGSGS